MNKLGHYLNILLAAFSIFISLAMLYVNLTDENGGVPYKHDLVHLSGKIAWIKKEEYGVEFQFKDSNIFLEYPSKLGEIRYIHKTLKQSIGHRVSVLYEETISREGFEGNVYHNVWTINIDDKVIRSYEESDREWRINNLWFFVLIPLLLFGGGYLGWNSYSQLKNNV